MDTNRLIINNKEFIPIKQNMHQFTENVPLNASSSMLTTAVINQRHENIVPDFRGMTLKQSMREAKDLGLAIFPVGTSGRVVWQSVSPGQLVDNTPKCTIKLESM